jgi:6-phosphogluconolactonase
MTSEGATGQVSAYVAVGPELINFDVDADAGRVSRRDSITLPWRVQYAWPHATLPVLYVACANREPGGGDRPFFLCALRFDESGDLSMHGTPAQLESRPIHVTTDVPSRHVLTGYGSYPGLSIHEILEDGSVGAPVPLPEPFDSGAPPTHQVRVTPSNARAIICARGSRYGHPNYVPGGLKVLRYDDGKVGNLYTIDLDGRDGLAGFNPRQLDFHPTLPILYLSLEAQNQLAVFRFDGEEIDPEPLAIRDLLECQDDMKPRQDGGAVQVHPNGKFVYVANRNDGLRDGPLGPSWLTPDPVPVFPGGENSIAVFSVDPDSGIPTRIQVADSHGLHPRTIGLDPSGRVLIAGNVSPTVLRDGDTLRKVPAGLALYRVEDGGTLAFAGTEDIDVGREMIWWTGVVGR